MERGAYTQPWLTRKQHATRPEYISVQVLRGQTNLLNWQFISFSAHAKHFSCYSIVHVYLDLISQVHASLVQKQALATADLGLMWQELIRRWDRERELFTTISHTYFKIPKREFTSFNKLDDIARQVLRIRSWIYEPATKFPPYSYGIFIGLPWASRGPSTDVYY